MKAIRIRQDDESPHLPHSSIDRNDYYIIKVYNVRDGVMKVFRTSNQAQKQNLFAKPAILHDQGHFNNPITYVKRQ